MHVIEQEIIEKFQQLDPEAKQRILHALSDSIRRSFDYDKWWDEVNTLQAEIRNRLGANATIDAISLLDELREEAS